MAVKTIGKSAPVARGGVVKQASNRIPTWLIVNGAAAGVIILIAALAVRGIMVKEDTPQCSERFTAGALLGLQDRSGAAIGAADLQSRLAGRDWGLLENLKIVTLKDGPAAVAMQVALPKHASKADEDTPQKSGMGFTWLQPKLAAAKAACLTYSVYLPPDFPYGAGGLLPGIFGGETADLPARGARNAFTVRNGWSDVGLGRVRTTNPAATDGVGFVLDPDKLKLERGRWAKIEQEVVLNQPGAEDGILRIWVDGKLQHEDYKMVFRADDKAQFRGVVADVHFGLSGTAPNVVPKATSLSITPFELRWQ